MHVMSPIAIVPNTAQRRSRATRARWANARLAIVELFRPDVLPVLALILVVSVWSYGFRLSHYQHNPDVTKASTIRMWVDHRHGSVVEPAEQHVQLKSLIGSALCSFEVPRLPHFSREEILAAPVQSAVATFVSPLYPLRAPPVSLSSLA